MCVHCFKALSFKLHQSSSSKYCPSTPQTRPVSRNCSSSKCFGVATMRKLTIPSVLLLLCLLSLLPDQGRKS
ncbi:hypothetical protein EV1_036775 [Malus domestica]